MARHGMFFFRRAPIAGLMLAGFFAGGCRHPECRSTATVDDYLPRDGAAAWAPAAGPGVAAAAALQPGTNAPLTVEACVRIGVDRNPLQRAAAEGMASARYLVEVARAPWYPQLDVGAGYSRWKSLAFVPGGLLPPGVKPEIGPVDDWSAAAKGRWLLFDSGQRCAELRAALAAQSASEADAERVRQELALNVQRAFYNRVIAEEQSAVAAKSRTRADDHLKIARDRRNAGAVPDADVLRVEVEAANARLTVVRAESAVRIAKAALNAAMGLPADLAAGPVAAVAEGADSAAVDLSRAMGRALHRRPELKAALERIEASRAALDAARSEFGPRIEAQAKYGWRDEKFLPESQDWLAGVAVDLPVFSGFSTVNRIRRSRADVAVAEAQVQSLILRVQREVVSAASKVREAAEAMTATDALVKQAAESLRMARDRYQSGAGVVVDLLDAEVALNRAEVEQTSAMWEYRLARAELEYATGSLVSQ